MKHTKFLTLSIVPAGVLLASCAAFAQVSSINSVILGPRTWNDIPGATIVTDGNYPFWVRFSEEHVSAPSGYANMDLWRFSNDGGATAYTFSNDDYFKVTMNLRLVGDPASPRKEAGFRLTSNGGEGQFIVNTDAHEIVAFGGPFPFYAFPSTYTSGDTINLGLTYFNDNGVRSIIYTANGVNSPALPFTNLEQGIIDGSTLGGYFQIPNDSGNPNNSGYASFDDISITVVPEPASLTLLGVGALALAFRRRE